VRETGEGELEPERDTDFDPLLAKKRYQVFKVYAVQVVDWVSRIQSIIKDAELCNKFTTCLRHHIG
jgi:hypothetical protein